MAKDFEVDFPKYMNQYPLFVYFPLDGVIVALSSWFISFWILSLVLGNALSMIVALFIGVFLYKKYKKYKRDVAPGYLSHCMYILGISEFKPPINHEEMTDFEEDNFLPAGYETVFEN